MSKTADELILEHYGKKGMRWGVRKGGGSRPSGPKGQRTTFQKPAKHLSDAELARRIKRIEMEKKYNELKKPDVSKGKKLTSEILGNAGKKAASGIIAGGIALAVAAVIARKNPGLAKELTGKDVGKVGFDSASKAAKAGKVAKDISKLSRKSPGGYL